MKVNISVHLISYFLIFIPQNRPQ